MRSVIAGLPASKIREVANAGLGRSDVVAFWFGESDEATPQAFKAAAIESLAAGETFYSHNLGLPELREALAGYVSSLHRPVSPERIVVTSSGVSGLMLANQLLVGPGDKVVAVVPVWPNIVAQPAILGADVMRVSLHVQEGAWVLDLPKLLDAITPNTRVLLVNAPSNPTGWTMLRDEQRAVLEHCRRTGTWIVADEVYERIWFGDGSAAPSFLDIAEQGDRLIVAHSFSKSFLMTGWRLGWLVLPPGFSAHMAKLVEFNTSCAPVFIQRAGLAAIREADDFVPGLVQRLKTCRDTLIPAISELPGVSVATPQGGMYAFFRVSGENDSLAYAKRLVEEVGLGLAPGSAFGDESEGWLRWCFASRDPQRLVEGTKRLHRGLGL